MLVVEPRIAAGRRRLSGRQVLHAFGKFFGGNEKFDAAAGNVEANAIAGADGGERPVNDLVDELGLAQPQVSKHLRVLREVGAVDVREEGRQRLYSINGLALKPIHDWVKTYERTWSERFESMDVVLEELKTEEADNGSDE